MKGKYAASTVIKLRRRIKKLERDWDDMYSSHCTSFERCKKCYHLHDSILRCPDCGHDNSEE